MTDAHTQHLARKCLEQLEELVLLNRLLPTQLAEIRTHLDPIARPAPPVVARKPATPLKTLPQCKAVWSYTATDTDELSFKENDIIEIVDEVDASWWKGRVVNSADGRKDEEARLFPSNYVEKIQVKESASTSSIALPSLPARNLPPVYTPSIYSDHSSSTYNDSTYDQQQHHKQDGGQIGMPSPYGGLPLSNWSSGVPPAMPPPPPGNGYASPSNHSQNTFMTVPQQQQPGPHYISPQPSGNYVSPSIPPEKQGLSNTPSNNSGYWQPQQQQHQDQAAAVGPSNPAMYGAPQPQPVPEDKNKHDKLKKFGGRLGGTMINSFAGGVGFGVGSHLF